MGNERFEHFLRAQELFKKHKIPADLVGKMGLSVAYGLYQRFAENAVVTVPGYVLGVHISEFSKIQSEVEVIPEKEHLEIEKMLRARNLKGLINFW